jgi:CheY-like chemotaxis protein
LDYINTPLGTRRILIADDTASSRDLLRSILEANGHVVEEAQDGQQVLEIIEGFGPHLVILDLHMPRLDGYSTAAALRKIPVFQRMPIVALTAAITQTAPDRIAEAGFSAYLVKPIRPSSLRECVANLLRERNIQRL